MRLIPAKQTTRPRRQKSAVQLRATMSRAASHRQMEGYDEEEEQYQTSEPNMKLSHAFIVVLILHVIAVGGVFGFNALKSRQQAIAKISAEADAQGKVEAPKKEALYQARTSAETNPKPIANAAKIPTTDATDFESPIADQQPIIAEIQTPISEAGIAKAEHLVVAGDTLGRIAGKYNTTVQALRNANHLTEKDVIRVGQTLQIPKATERSVIPNPNQAPPTGTTANATKQAEALKSQQSMSTAKPQIQQAKPSAQTKPAATAVKAKEKPATYEVVKGDNPYNIAKKFNISYQKLLEANHIDDPTKLQIGQQLRIP